MKKLLYWTSKLENKKICGINLLSEESIDIFTWLIIISALLMGWEVVEPHPYFPIIQRVILYLFLIEIFLRAMLAQYKRQLNRHMKNGWTIFDIIVVGAGFVPSNFQSLSNILRIVRVFRIFRVVKAFPELKLIVSIVLKSIPRMATIIILLLILMYIFAIIGIEMFGYREANPKGIAELATFQETFFTLFVSLTGEEWADIRKKTMESFGYWGPTTYFVTWIILSSFLTFNLFVGVIIDSFNVLRESEQKRKRFQALNRTDPYTVVLGWNPDAIMLLKNLIEANRSLVKSTIVVLGENGIEDMDEAIEHDLYSVIDKDSIYTELIIREGSPKSAHDLSLIMSEECQSIIILPENLITNDRDKQMANDLQILEILTALSGVIHRKKISLPSIIAPYYNTIEGLPTDKRLISLDKITHFNPVSLVSKILCQYTMSSGTSRVIEKLFSFQECEIYVKKATTQPQPNTLHNIVGYSPRELIGHFYPSILIGWCPKGKQICFCNDPDVNLDEPIQEEDLLYFLSDDDSSIRYQKNKASFMDLLDIEPTTTPVHQDSHILILGWGPMTQEYLNQLGNCQDPVKVSIATNEADEEIPGFVEQLNLSLVENTIVNDINNCFELLTKEHAYPITSVAFFTSEIFQQDSRRNLLSIIKIRDLAKKLASPLRIVAQISEEKYVSTIDMLGLQDIVYPNYFIVGYMAILSQQPLVRQAYRQIIGNNNSNISMATLEQFEQKRERSILLGFYLNKADKDGKKLYLCPDLLWKKTLSAKDKLVILHS